MQAEALAQWAWCSASAPRHGGPRWGAFPVFPSAPAAREGRQVGACAEGFPPQGSLLVLAALQGRRQEGS